MAEGDFGGVTREGMLLIEDQELEEGADTTVAKGGNF
jgi:hypothetical protein